MFVKNRLKIKKPHIVPKYVLYSFFVLGLLSAVAFRAIIVFQHLKPLWVRPVWYVGVLGYLMFFFYRFKITKKRKKAISDFKLLEKLKDNVNLTDRDRNVLIYLLCSLKVSPEDMNYAVIFLLSLIAIVFDMILTSGLK
jgi:hypothetical protein